METRSLSAFAYFACSAIELGNGSSITARDYRPRGVVIAWAVFANHYHIVARGNPDSRNLGEFLHDLHGVSARELNKLDSVSDRKVWCNFRDTKLTIQHSYLAQLNYVHQNAVKHKLVAVANQYPWCSAAWFERVASPAQVKTI